MGRAARHDLLRDRDRHRGARTASVRGGAPVMNTRGVLKRTGLIAGVAAGVAGVVYAGERAVVARIRHRDDPDAGLPLVPEFDTCRTLDSHDRGTIYTITRTPDGRGDAPPVVFCHGVTLSSRVWAKQFQSFPAEGFRAV